MTQLSRRRLEWLVRARGTDLSTWPETDRCAALDLMRRSPDAQRAFADALVDDDAPETDGPMLDRMQEALRRSLAPLSLLMRSLRAGALIACVTAGCYLATTQNLATQYLAATATDPDSLTDPFTSAQTISLAALDQ